MLDPTNEIRILLVTKDASVADEVHEACTHTPTLTLVGTIARADEAASVAQQRHAQVILLDDSVLDDLEQVIMDVTLAAPECYVFTLVPEGNLEMAQRTLLAGARGFISKPLNNEELARTITRVITLETLRRTRATEEAGRAAPGKIITVVSAKGGVGRTIVATNLAVALHQATEEPTLLLEAMNVPGDMPAALAMLTQISLADIIASQENLNIASLAEVIPQHDSGIHILPGVLDYDTDPIDRRGFLTFLRLATRMFSYIIIDTEELQDPLTEIAINEADHVLLITSPELLALHRTVKLYEALVENAEVERDKILPVLNKEGLKGGVRKNVLEQLLGIKFEYTVGYDADTVMESVRKGVPFIISAQRSDVAQDIHRLVNGIISAPQDGDGTRHNMPSRLWDRMRHLLASAAPANLEALRSGGVI